MFLFAKIFFITIAYLTLIDVLACEANIHDKVSYHELIRGSETSVKTRIRRSVDQSKDMMNDLTKEFHFTAYNMTFVCHMTPRTGFFSPKFKLKVYGADGVPREFGFRHDQVYVGSCDGDPQSEIRGTFKGDIFTGSLFYKGQMYGIEDAARHIPSVPISEQMIVYRNADMKWNKENKDNDGGRFCGNTDGFSADPVADKEEIVVDKIVQDHHSGRKKRATVPTWDTCRIVAVADYKFFREIGKSDVYDTALHLAGVMDRVDNIFRRTEFNVNGVPYTGMGFEIAEMRIFEAPTIGFNKDTGSWEAQTLLQTFSTDLTFKSYCVAHLFTHQSFQGNTLGMAYIASDRNEDIGGICSPESYIRSLQARASENTGFTSTRNGYGETVLLQQSDLVTAHELGHNWGSNHDPSSGSCSPSDIFGNGKYIMYAISVSGYDSNNFLFSTCSRNAIGRVLLTKGQGCFTARATDESLICGNGKIDSGEECDAGFLGRLNLDPCCNNDCTLTRTSTCSPGNHECCVNCQLASQGLLCRADSGIDCQKSAYCTGSSLVCPASEDKDDGDECLDEGKCEAGECLPFCQARNLTSCACSDLANSCQRCCRTGEGAECVPYDNNHPLPDGRPCVAGYCEGAVCQASSESTIQRLFSIFDNLDVNSVVKFFRDNLVGCVIVFSLILWIPASIAVSCMDRRRRKRLNRSEEIEIRRDRELLFDEDGRKVGPAQSSVPQNGTTSPRYRTLNFTDLGGFGSDA
ncbi:ADAM 17-like protease [Aplysia californica]|uniref:ADAM 17-like protease n=1 Tax=Aplysia californica TaxID=6500 RepID=A0ABM0JLG6_APLCA|nr:ADAM 17-like protease [Aplysia californica]